MSVSTTRPGVAARARRKAARDRRCRPPRRARARRAAPCSARPRSASSSGAARRHEIVHEVVARATESNTPATRRAFSSSGTSWKPKWVVFFSAIYARTSRASRYGARFAQPAQILLPHRLLALAVVVQQIPRIDAGIVAVGEPEAAPRTGRRARPRRSARPSCPPAALPGRAVAAHFGRRRIDAQEFGRQHGSTCRRRTDFQDLRFLVQLDLGRRRRLFVDAAMAFVSFSRAPRRARSRAPTCSLRAARVARARAAPCPRSAAENADRRRKRGITCQCRCGTSVAEAREIDLSRDRVARAAPIRPRTRLP